MSVRRFGVDLKCGLFVIVFATRPAKIYLDLIIASAGIPSIVLYFRKHPLGPNILTKVDREQKKLHPSSAILRWGCDWAVAGTRRPAQKRRVDLNNAGGAPALSGKRGGKHIK